MLLLPLTPLPPPPLLTLQPDCCYCWCVLFYFIFSLPFSLFLFLSLIHSLIVCSLRAFASFFSFDFGLFIFFFLISFVYVLKVRCSLRVHHHRWAPLPLCDDTYYICYTYMTIIFIRFCLALHFSSSQLINITNFLLLKFLSILKFKTTKNDLLHIFNVQVDIYRILNVEL